MGGDSGYLIVLLLVGVPLGLLLAQIWARSRSAGAARLDQGASKAEPVPDPAMQPELQPDPEEPRRD